MKDKISFISRLIYSVIITLILLYFFNITSNGKIIFIPFLVCSFAIMIKNIFSIMDKQNYVKAFNKIYIIGFLLFWFGFLVYWCYTSIISKNFLLLLLSIPFWICGIFIIKKTLFKSSKNFFSNSFKLKKKFNYKIIISGFLVVATFISGILMLFWGIKDTYKLKKETKKYIITNGYFKDYEIYKSDKDGITYKLTYIYEVNNKEYYITANYGTNYIPDENSIREVKYNPKNPEEAILVGTNNKNILIYMGAFFTLGAFTFILFALTLLGFFDKVKIDIIGTYIGMVFLIIGSGIIIFQTSTTMSLIKTIKSFGLWILIPIMFIVVGIYQLIKCLFLNHNALKIKK